MAERRELPDPARRAALARELDALIAAAPLSPEEAVLLRHVLAHAGFGLDGLLRFPAFSVLWGGAEGSYFPPAPLPAAQARAAARVLQRRGVLRADAGANGEHAGVVLDSSALRELGPR